MRRLKNGITSLPSPRPKLKMSDPSRKKVRFSGKNSGKRVRLVRRASTSVSAKSVLTEPDATRFGPMRCLTSRLASAVTIEFASGAGMPPPPVTAGRTRKPRPEVEVGQIGEQSGATRLRQLPVAGGARPPIGLLPPLDPALDVEVPAASGLP